MPTRYRALPTHIAYLSLPRAPSEEISIRASVTNAAMSSAPAGTSAISHSLLSPLPNPDFDAHTKDVGLVSAFRQSPSSHLPDLKTPVTSSHTLSTATIYYCVRQLVSDFNLMGLHHRFHADDIDRRAFEQTECSSCLPIRMQKKTPSCHCFVRRPDIPSSRNGSSADSLTMTLYLRFAVCRLLCLTNARHAVYNYIDSRICCVTICSSTWLQPPYELVQNIYIMHHRYNRITKYILFTLASLPAGICPVRNKIDEIRWPHIRNSDRPPTVWVNCSFFSINSVSIKLETDIILSSSEDSSATVLLLIPQCLLVIFPVGSSFE